MYDKVWQKLKIENERITCRNTCWKLTLKVYDVLINKYKNKENVILFAKVF